MFLHIGNNIIVNKKEIIGIFNIKSISNTGEYKNIIKDLKEKNKLIENENVEDNTLILTEDKNGVCGYKTNISSITLAKRIQNYKKCNMHFRRLY